MIDWGMILAVIALLAFLGLILLVVLVKAAVCRLWRMATRRHWSYDREWIDGEREADEDISSGRWR